MMTKGEQYRGFKVLDVVDVEDCEAKGIYLKHEKTGLEVFHLLNEDEETFLRLHSRHPRSTVQVLPMSLNTAFFAVHKNTP